MMDLLHASGLLMQEGLPASLGLPTLPAIVFTPWGQPGGPAAAAAAAEAAVQETVPAIQQGQAPSEKETDLVEGGQVAVSAGHVDDTATTVESAGAHGILDTTAAAAAAAAARAVPGLPLAMMRIIVDGSDEAWDPLRHAHPGVEAEAASGVNTAGDQAGVTFRYGPGLGAGIRAARGTLWTSERGGMARPNFTPDPAL